MPNVTFAGMTYACTKAIKGYNYIELQDDSGRMICRFDDITNFSAFSITDGEWSDPPAVQSVMATDAVLTGGSIVLTTDPARHVGTGTMVKFNAPCDCTAVTGGLVIGNKNYSIVNTMGEVATGKGGTWCAGAQIAALMDCENSKAYILASASSSGGGAQVLGYVGSGGNYTLESSAFELSFDIVPKFVIMFSKLYVASYISSTTPSTTEKNVIEQFDIFYMPQENKQYQYWAGSNTYAHCCKRVGTTLKLWGSQIKTKYDTSSTNYVAIAFS